MRFVASWLMLGSVMLGSVVAWAQGKGILLEDLTWQEAEKVLRPDTIVVIPIGAASKEHGPHLKLKNDWVMAEYLKREVLTRADVVVAPTVNYHYYPAFVDYPGSTNLRLETARDLLIDICRALSRFGPKKFYALNTGVSTLRALQPTAEALAADGITFRYTNILTVSGEAEQKVKQEEKGTHADEIETSIMLYIAPGTVDMKKAVKDYGNPSKGRKDSPSGVFGDATLATRAKGEIVVKAMVEGILRDIDAMRR